MSVKMLSKDDKASTSVNVETDNAVTATFTCRVNETSGDRYSVTTQFDFSKCSRAELLGLATRAVVIDAQRQWRVLANSDLKKATEPSAFAKVDVKADILDATRKTADPIARAKSALEKLSPEERKALLKSLAS